MHDYGPDELCDTDTLGTMSLQSDSRAGATVRSVRQQGFGIVRMQGHSDNMNATYTAI